MRFVEIDYVNSRLTMQIYLTLFHMFIIIIHVEHYFNLMLQHIETFLLVLSI